MLACLALTVLPLSTAVAQSVASLADGRNAFQSGRYQEAAQIWQGLANQGDADAQYAMGTLYESGLGVQRDLGQARRWYQMAAVQGLPAAQNNLARMLSLGEGVPKDQARAITLWRDAAKRGNAQAQYNLGFAYYNGDGLPKDSASAVSWFESAASQGLPQAQYALGEMTLNGVGVTANRRAAGRWFQLAAASGYGPAQTRLTELGLAVPQGGQTAAIPRTPTPSTSQPIAREPSAVVGAGQAFLWLGTGSNEGEARRLADQARQNFPDLFAQGGPQLEPIQLAGRRAVRVVAGPLPSVSEAATLCRQMRQRVPSMFCAALPAN